VPDPAGGGSKQGVGPEHTTACENRAAARCWRHADLVRWRINLRRSCRVDLENETVRPKRQLSLLQAVSLNMAMMVGVGPFITIPLFIAAMAGPQAMVGWALGALVAIADGFVWSELAAAFPGSGGTYHFYDAVYGQARVGRLFKFLFVWQFLFSGPLELASGAMGLAQYAGFFWEPLKKVAWRVAIPAGASQPWIWEVTWGQTFAMAAMAVVVAMAYRRIEVAGRLMVTLWAGMLLTVAWMIVAGLTRFNASQAFDFPPRAWTLSPQFARGLGVALGIAMYDYFGYYQICYLGDEVSNPARTIPRSILISVIVISAVYLTMNVGILGVLPWRDVVASKHIASDFMLARYGPWAARAITILILWTGTASTFAGVLGYSRIPYAAARTGHFFRWLAHTHPRGGFPDRSLLLVGVVSALACLVDLPTVIGALIASRILIQFVGQIGTVAYLRTRPDLLLRLPYRMPLFPLPAIFALVGWLYVFGTLEIKVIVYGLLSMGLGWAAFEVRDMIARQSKTAKPPEG
jgi:amino acid transporter